VEDVGHLDCACDDLLELAARRPAEEFAARYHRRRTVPDLLPKIAAAATYLNTVLRHVYRWLFGDEALYVVGMEPRVEAGPRFVEGPGLGAVHVPHPDTGDLVLVTREEVARHGADDLRVLNFALRYDEAPMRWHERLIRALRRYGDRGTSVGEVPRRAAADHGIDAAGRGFEALAELVVAAASSVAVLEQQDGPVSRCEYRHPCLSSLVEPAVVELQVHSDVHVSPPFPVRNLLDHIRKLLSETGRPNLIRQRRRPSVEAFEESQDRGRSLPRTHRHEIALDTALLTEVTRTLVLVDHTGGRLDHNEEAEVEAAVRIQDESHHPFSTFSRSDVPSRRRWADPNPRRTGFATGARLAMRRAAPALGAQFTPSYDLWLGLERGPMGGLRPLRGRGDRQTARPARAAGRTGSSGRACSG